VNGSLRVAAAPAPEGHEPLHVIVMKPFALSAHVQPVAGLRHGQSLQLPSG
jgi:hypothetical protein